MPKKKKWSSHKGTDDQHTHMYHSFYILLSVSFTMEVSTQL